MAKQVTEAIITLNGKQPIEVLNQIHSAAEKIKTAMEDVQQKMKGMSPKDEAYKNLSATVKDLKKQYDVLASAQVKDIEATDRLRNAVDNLATTSLTNLRKALGDGKRKMDGLSEAELEQANTLRSLMKIVGDQVRLLEGKYVKIREGLASIGTQSDQWLSKAIAQQQELMAATRRGTKEYKDQEQVLQMLTAEQEKRNASISAEATARRQAQFKQQVASSRQMLSSGNLGNYSQSEIQTSINTLRQAQSQVKMGGSEWTQFAEEIKKAEAELDKLMGKTKEVKHQMSEGEAKSILGNIGDHTEQEVREAINALKMLQSTVNVGGSQWNDYAADIEKAEAELGKLTGRVKEAAKGLSMDEVDNRIADMSSQSESSLKEMLGYLQKAKAELAPYSQEWQNVANRLDMVKQRMADVQANTPYVRNEASAQNIARNNQLNFGNGQTYDVTRKDLQWSKDYLQKQLDVTPVADTAKIQEIQEALGLIDERMKALDGNTEKASMSAEKLEQVLGDMKTASLEELRDAAAELKKQLNGLAPSSDAAKQIKKQLQDLDKEINQVQDDVVDVNDVISRSKNGKASIEELKKAYKQLQQEIEKIDTDSNDFKSKRKALDDLKKKIDIATGAAQRHGGVWNTALKNLTAYVGLFQVFNTVKRYFVDLFRLNMQFSEQLTDIRKVALSTTDEIADLSRELSKLDTRTSLEELNRIAYAGAKLGIQTQGGTAALAGFVRAADQVNVALKEDLGDEALTSLAKITEVMGLVKKYGVEQAMLKTGSAIFRLASTSTATSGKIVDFSNRMLALGEQAALTTPDILALGAAVDSMALEPEVAATAFGKLVTELRKGTSPIEKSLGIATGSLKKMIESGKGMDAILTIFRKMGETKNVFALDGLFKDMGSDGARLVKTMVTMAAKNGMLTKAVEESNKAFADGTAVSVEYNMQQETAAAYMQRASNLWEKQFVSASAASGPVRDIAKAWFEVTKELTSSMSFMSEVRILITLIFASVKMLLAILPTLITTLSMAGLAGAFAKLLTYLQGVEAASLTLGSAWTKMITTFNKLSLVKQAGIMGGLIGLAGVFVVKLVEWTASLNQLAAGQRVLNEVQEEGKRKAMEEQEQLKRLHNVMNDTSASMDLRLEAMNKLNGAIPNLNARINTETGVVKENTKAWADNFKRLQDYYELEGARAKLADLGRQKVDAILDLQKKEEAYANTNVDVQTGTRPVTSSGAVMASQAQGAIGQAGQKAAAKRARDKAQKEYDDIVAQEDALRKRFGAKLDVGDGKAVGTPQKVTESGKGNATAPEDDARNNISEFITKIKNFYERQVTATVEDLTRKNVPKTLQKQAEQDIRRRMDAVLAAAKTSLVLGTKEWEKIKDTIDKDRKEKDDEFGQSQSRILERQILGFDVGKLRTDLLKQMPKIKKGKIVGYKSDERDRAYLDTKWLEASKSEQNIANADRDAMEKRRKELFEHDYTAVVKENSFLGLIDADMADVTLANFKRDKDAVIQVLEKARKQIDGIFATNGEKDKLLKFLFGDDYQNMPQQFMFLLDAPEEDVKYFYQKLIQYSDEYTEAEKKQYDEAKKVTDFMWKSDKRNLANQDRLRKMQNESNLFGKRTNLLSNLGLADLTADPEVELMKARMQAAEDYYAFVEKNSKNQQLIDEAERARQEAELNYANQMATAMKNRLSQMKELVQPITDFGAAVGNALAEMKNDAESANEAIKNALKSMLQSWGQMALNDINTQMWKAINDAGAKKGRKDAQPGIDAARANATANATDYAGINWRDIGTENNPLWVRWTGDHYEDKNGTPYYTKADGTPLSNTDNGTAQNEPPRAWQKRHPDGTIEDYNREVQGIAGQTGDTIANVATGNSSLGEAGAGLLASGANALLNAPIGGGKSKEDKEKDKQLKKEKKHQKELTKETKKGAKDREKENEKGVKNITATSAEANKEQTKGEELKQNTISAISDTAMTMNLKAKQDNDAQVVEQSKDTAQAENTFSIVGAIGKCFEFLGPIAGPIAAASVMAILTGLMNWGLSAAFGSKSKKSSSSGKNTKLVSGMLTYDSGNVQDLKPFVADNGEVYWAEEQSNVPTAGASLLTTPTATTINGQRSLVAENGPELVIGRETTKAMMMNNPSLLKALVNYDRNYSGRNAARRTFDDGNIGEALGTNGANLVSGASATDDVISNATATNIALLQVANALLERLSEPISAKIDMYGRGNLYDSMTKANQFMKGKS